MRLHEIVNIPRENHDILHVIVFKTTRHPHVVTTSNHARRLRTRWMRGIIHAQRASQNIFALIRAADTQIVFCMTLASKIFTRCDDRSCDERDGALACGLLWRVRSRQSRFAPIRFRDARMRIGVSTPSAQDSAAARLAIKTCSIACVTDCTASRNRENSCRTNGCAIMRYGVCCLRSASTVCMYSKLSRAIFSAPGR